MRTSSARFMLIDSGLLAAFSPSYVTKMTNYFSSIASALFRYCRTMKSMFMVQVSGLLNEQEIEWWGIE